MKMRVLHVVEATIAGVRTHVQSLVTGLDPQRFHQIVACPLRREQAFGDERFVEYLTRAGIAVLPVAMRRSIDPRSDAAALRQLVGILGRGHFDIVHLHSSKAGFLGRLAVRLARSHAGTVYSPHGLAFLGDHTPARRLLYLTLERAVGRLGDRIIAVSESEREIICSNGLAPSERVVLIENGITAIAPPTADERAARRRALGQRGDGPLIGTVARLCAQKNPRLFVEAAARVLRQRPDSVFVWCGSGELAATTRAHARELGIADACRFLGHREDVPAIIGALDLFWMTSDFEGMPLAPIEAMNVAVPIVGTDVIGTRDLIVPGETGALVPAGDPVALAQASVALLSDPRRMRALGEAGRARARQRYSVERMLEETAALYESLIEATSQERAGRRSIRTVQKKTGIA